MNFPLNGELSPKHKCGKYDRATPEKCFWCITSLYSQPGTFPKGRLKCYVMSPNAAAPYFPWGGEAKLRGGHPLPLTALGTCGTLPLYHAHNSIHVHDLYVHTK